jgi:hypothetical protein
MPTQLRLALIAHDEKKAEMVAFAKGTWSASSAATSQQPPPPGSASSTPVPALS